MTTPASAVVWPQPLDPADRADYVAQFGGLMAGAETLQSMTITILPEAAALGLTIIEDASHGPAIVNGSNILMWFEIAEGMQDDAAFVAGALLPIEITIDTDATPPRRFQRTMAVRVIQQ